MFPILKLLNEMREQTRTAAPALLEPLDEIIGEANETISLIREANGYAAYYRRVLEKFELDTLTGLPGSNKYIDFKADLNRRPAPSVGVIVFDVNDLKYYNDNKGHQAGDLLLQKAAESFHHIDDGKYVRVFRTGGDEFVAIAVNCSESDMLRTVAEWKEKLASLNAAGDGIICSVAYGTAFGTGNYALSDVLKLADERMYAEKRRMKESGVKLGDVR